MKNLIFKIFSTVILSVIAYSSYAQEHHALTISGFIEDNDGNPIEAATVILLSKKDSTFIDGTASGKNGSFNLVIDNKESILKVSFIGYQTYTTNLPATNKKKINIGHIKLKTDNNILKETVITAEAQPIRILGDTISYSTAAIPLFQGAVLSDIIKRIPGAEISPEGKITLNGKEISKIMVDGKEFFTNDPGIALNNLPAEAVKEIKAYDRKTENARTTGIDDGEEVNVLDVTIKEGMKKGWFGNMIAGLGNEHKYEAGAMMNRFRGDMQVSFIGSANNTNGQGFNDISNADIGAGGKSPVGEKANQSFGINFTIDKKNIELHTDISYGHDDEYLLQRNSRQTFLSEMTSFSQKEKESNTSRHRIRGNIRLKWCPDSLTEIHFNHNVNTMTGDASSFMLSLTTDNLDSINNAISQSYTSQKDISFGGDLMINRRLGKKGRNITLRLAYRKNNNQNDELDISDTYFYLNDSIALINRYIENGSNILSYNAELAYSEPLWKNAILRVAYKYSNSSSSSFRIPVFDYDMEQAAMTIANQTYNDNNKHTIEALIQSNTKNIHYNFGIGVVPLSTHTRVTAGVNSGLDKSQLSLNYQPTANLIVRFNSHNQLRISYRGISNAPSINYLQEIIDISDPMHLQFGNPNLKNTYNQNVIVGYSIYTPQKGRSSMLNLMFNNTINGLTQKTSYNPETGVSTTRMENINGNWRMGLNYGFSSPLRNKKFNMGTNLYSSYSHRVGYSSIIRDNNGVNISKSDNVMIGNKTFASYRTEMFDCYLATVFDSNHSRNNFDEKNESSTYSYGVNASTNISLPWDMQFSTDLNYLTRTGYVDGYNDDNVLWNIQISKNFLKNKQATIRFKVYDLLQSRNNTFRTMAFNYTQDTETNIIGRYFIIHFVYRLNNADMPKRRPPHRRPLPI